MYQKPTPTAIRLLHPPQHPRLTDICHVDENIIRRVTVQRCTKSFLVKVVSNETDGTTKDEQTVESTNLYYRPQESENTKTQFRFEESYLDILLCLLPRKRTTISQQIDETNSNTPIDVQDQSIFLGRSDFFDG